MDKEQLSLSTPRRLGGGIESKVHSFLTSTLDARAVTLGSSCSIPGKGHWYPFYRRLGGMQSRSGRVGEEKYLYF
jgi:hypothetical protein